MESGGKDKEQGKPWETSMTQDIENNKLWKMKAAAYQPENLTGYEEQLAGLKSDIKEQQKKSSNMSETPREEQAQALLTSNIAKMNANKQQHIMVKYHQERKNNFWE
eukprot:3200899-Heterocapsa_arctica.AAC.1